MKVYLEEKDMPKDCVNCDFGYANNFCEIDYELDLRKFDKNQKHPKCPLQSLSDYTKQVRKEVVQELKSRFLAICQIECGNDIAYFNLEVLNRILEKIIGETK